MSEPVMRMMKVIGDDEKQEVFISVIIEITRISGSDVLSFVL
jgi:hypothetical protein